MDVVYVHDRCYIWLEVIYLGGQLSIYNGDFYSFVDFMGICTYIMFHQLGDVFFRFYGFLSSGSQFFSSEPLFHRACWNSWVIKIEK